ncbi:hypothetical protein GCM10011529_16570 [Polymorphobacter glacialis]|uniref:Uncharacterized protein n=2 Tax=Sandarakinorhabdus glacialis TaxID=1614636 RepID=A0A917E755_9SPHN|nr:hypothetical protein GCM10011529_16570 [Polymorphobacter glacialis]
MICADPDLAALDRVMASRYRARVGRVDVETERRLDQDQSDFRNARSQCADAQCVEWLYRQRIGELE